MSDRQRATFSPELAVDPTGALPRWLWTAEEVAAVLGVTPDCVKNLHRVGQLAGVMVGRHRRWRPEDVRDFVQTLKPGKELDARRAVG